VPACLLACLPVRSWQVKARLLGGGAVLWAAVLPAHPKHKTSIHLYIFTTNTFCFRPSNETPHIFSEGKERRRKVAIPRTKA